ncbi:MAG: hypothetical protein KDK66_08690 [Deltaproteobacteria bacterium]|nr:hypothetical protein [Deltaproteobacteria bacterium]
MILKLFKKTSQITQGLLHLGRLGSKASRLSFLKRERRKFLSKLGEETYQLIQKGRLKSPGLKRLALQVQKIDQLMSESDYGGEKGTPFKGKD